MWCHQRCNLIALISPRTSSEPIGGACARARQPMVWATIPRPAGAQTAPDGANERGIMADPTTLAGDSDRVAGGNGPAVAPASLEGAPPPGPIGRAEPAFQGDQGGGRPDRLSLLWKYKWWISCTSLAVAVLTLVVSLLTPATYESSALVRVALPVTGSVGHESIIASNDLARQYAELVASTPVITAAAQVLGIPPSTLRSDVSGGTLQDQNLIEVKAQASSPAEAVRRANAVAAALTSAIQSANSSQASAYEETVRKSLAPLDQAIVSARADAAQSGTLATLLAQRASLAAGLARDGNAGQPTVGVWSSAGSGRQIQPRVVLYTLVAALVALLAAGQLTVVLKGRRASL
jgi:capsular polysaccharide biosynthesis protein